MDQSSSSDRPGETDPKSSAPAPVPADADSALAHRLKEAREARQLTQKGVATRSKWADPEGKGISRTALIGYEAGTSRPGARELRILSQTLVISPNKLLFGTETPLTTSHAALETLTGERGRMLRGAVEVAFVIAALKGHERDALLSLALSLAGRQLGDVRLSGLRTLANLVAPEVGLALKGMLEDEVDIADLTLEQLAEKVSRTVDGNVGTNLKLNDAQDIRGEWLYPDPDDKHIKS